MKKEVALKPPGERGLDPCLHGRDQILLGEKGFIQFTVLLAIGLQETHTCLSVLSCAQFTGSHRGSVSRGCATRTLKESLKVCGNE